MEDLLRKLPGVIDTEVGYAGGTNESPTYQNHSGHAEALQITYNQEITSFTKLLDTFFQLHDPTTHNRQGNDIGLSYRSAIFYNNEMEKEEAKQMIEIVNSSGRWSDKVVTTLEPLTVFWPAEEYHQDYLLGNPDGYTCHYLRQGGSYLK